VTPAAADLLETIIASTRRRVAVRQARESRASLESRASAQTPRGDRFEAALAETTRINVIAECKRRSPSRGVLRAAYDPVQIARAYEQAGAAAVSVLTEPTFFDGTLDHLRAVRHAVRLPLVRKDFVVDSYQLLEARANGADAVLLIVAALTDRELQALHQTAVSLGLAVLVEVHDVVELERALDSGARLIGVNNRNLRTLDVHTQTSEQVAERIPSGVVAVSESGLRTPEDLTHLRALGYRAFLIGERLMTSPDPGAALAALLGSAPLGKGPAPFSTGEDTSVDLSPNVENGAGPFSSTGRK
jgi:indole-3-glycerol phosphate synthase